MARRGRVLLTAAALVGWQTGVVPRLPEDPRVRTPAQLALAAVGLAAARRHGLSWEELGLARGSLGRGARAAGWALAATAGAAAAAQVLPRDHDDDLPLPDTRGARLLEEVAVHIPLGTVLAEELLFRGVLHALADRHLATREAGALGATTFALWHLAPGLEDARRTTRPAAYLAGTLALTGAADVVLGTLRRRTGSLLAPAGLHLGTNALGLLAVRLRTRRG